MFTLLDPPRGQEYWTSCDNDFTHAIDLVRFIRKEYGDYFCIGVAGEFIIYNLN